MHQAPLEKIENLKKKKKILTALCRRLFSPAQPPLRTSSPLVASAAVPSVPLSTDRQPNFFFFLEKIKTPVLFNVLCVYNRMTSFFLSIFVVCLVIFSIFFLPPHFRIAQPIVRPSRHTNWSESSNDEATCNLQQRKMKKKNSQISNFNNSYVVLPCLLLQREWIVLPAPRRRRPSQSSRCFRPAPESTDQSAAGRRRPLHDRPANGC